MGLLRAAILLCASLVFLPAWADDIPMTAHENAERLWKLAP
jgi:hypothetical protein